MGGRCEEHGVCGGWAVGVVGESGAWRTSKEIRRGSLCSGLGWRKGMGRGIWSVDVGVAAWCWRGLRAGGGSAVNVHVVMAEDKGAHRASLHGYIWICSCLRIYRRADSAMGSMSRGAWLRGRVCNSGAGVPVLAWAWAWAMALAA